MAQRYEIEAWLGDALDDMTEQQFDDMEALILRWEDDHPDEYGDDVRPEDSSEVWIAAMEAVTGALALPAADRRLLDARIDAADAYMYALAAGYMAVRHMGAAEATAAREAGIDRMSLRKALGK